MADTIGHAAARGVGTALRDGVARFPVAAAFSGVATVAALTLTGVGMQTDNTLWLSRLALTVSAVSGFVAALAMALVAERNGRTWGARQLASAAAGLAAFLPGWLLREPLDLQLWLFLPALIALLTLAGTSRVRDGDAGLWRFNHDLWVGAAFALLAVVLLAGGLSAIIVTSGYLLGTPSSDLLVGRVWTVALGFAGPILWLTQVPPAGGHPPGEGYASGLISRAIAAIVTYILAPLQLVYAAILHLYAAKIAIAGALPEGELGWMVVIFGAVAVTTALLAHPTGESGPGWMRLYARIWPWTLAVPALLLLLAIGERIGAYGWTEQRYLIVLFGVWLALVILTQGVPGRWRTIRLIPALAGGALLLASFGPWGAAGLSERMQAANVVAALKEAGALGEDGQLKAWPDLSKLPEESQRRAAAGLDHLMARDRLARLAPVFARLPDTPFVNTALGQYELGGSLKLKLALNELKPAASVQRVGFYVMAPIAVDRAEGVRLVGPVTLEAGALPQVASAAAGEISLLLSDGAVDVVDRKRGLSARFDLGADAALRAAVEAQSKPGADTSRQTPLLIKRTSGPLEATLVLVQAWGDRDATGKLVFNQAGGWVLIAVPAP